MNTRYEKSLQERLTPPPRELLFGNGIIRVTSDTRCVIEAPEDCVDVDGVTKVLRDFWQVGLRVQNEPLCDDLSELGNESYRLSIGKNEIRIRARSDGALRYALATLRQLAEPSRGTATVEYYTLPQCEITDYPQIAFRGIHFCAFPETPVWMLEKQIRLAAYYKFNHVVLEFWGVFSFASHPEFAWKDMVWSRADVTHIRDVAQEVGITIIPQFNVFGHASMARVGTAKHAVLDFNPALQSLFEPDGWCYCLTNPHTRKVLTDLVEELHEFFGNPPYFHIGCDEAHGFASCSECAQHSPAELLKDHILWFHKLLQGRGARAIMWHDMLIVKADERWKGWIACGDESAAEILHQLPRDIMIADWQYYGISEEFSWEQPMPTAKYFSDEGFDVLLCPWTSPKNITRLGHEAEQQKLAGLLTTTWHTTYAHTLHQLFVVAAAAGWNGGAFAAKHASVAGLPLHLRQVGWDMNVKHYQQTGSCAHQILPETVQGIGHLHE